MKEEEMKQNEMAAYSAKISESRVTKVNEGDPHMPSAMTDILNRYFDNISVPIFPKPKSQPHEYNDMQSIKWSEYPNIEASKDLDKKIAALQNITQSIELKETDLSAIAKQDFSKFKIDYCKALNQSQLAAVAITEKPVLVIAGAGTGKTRVIVHRVCYLIEKGIDPRSILLLTFTRKASREMLERVETLLHDKRGGNITGGTFHSFAAFILRKYSKILNLPQNFTIVDPSESQDIIDLLRSEFKFNTKGKKFPEKKRIYDIISYARNNNTNIRSIVLEQYSGLIEYIPDIELLFDGYTRFKPRYRILDFDDLMEVFRDSLRDNIRFRHNLQSQYMYVMVDEFQDTNLLQKQIIDLISEKYKKIMVVGDDAQSIYTFRGANYENILRFPETYPDCAVIKIEENYRSNQKILDFTNAIVDNSKIGFKKKLFTKNFRQTIPIIKRVFGEHEEAEFIADIIMELTEQNIPLNEIAILNRADWHNHYIQLEMSKRGIPYVVVGGFRFNERFHVKDVISYLRIIYNPADAVAWHRVLKYISGVGKITAGDIINDILNNSDPFSFEIFKLRKFYSELVVLAKMLKKASEPEFNPSQKIDIIIEYYSPILKERDADFLNKLQDISVLIDISRKYKALDKFLSDFALDPPSKRVADQSHPLIDENEEQGKVTISTIHSAKGLEWYCVFVPHALEGLIPSNRAINIEEVEEERRIFYVACSRAKEQLYITFPRNVYSRDAFFHLPSRFLLEIDNEKYAFYRD
jgi:DNA helicase II / ATP-dependent DNA helicase PcrA